MPQRLEAQGNKEGKEKWDDGSDHDNVTKIYVRADPQGIRSIRFDYIKSGQPIYGPFHTYSSPGLTQTFEINNLKDEQLVSVDGYYEPKSMVILGVQFKTNLRISELIGIIENDGTKFSLAVEGKKIVGFHGSSDVSLNSLGAYFTSIVPTISVARGGKGGTEWNDGSDHEGITNISVRGACTGVRFIKIDYIKDGQQIYGPIHGESGKGYTQEFKIDHFNKEYLVAVEGYYDEKSGVIQGLLFKTNTKTSDLIGNDTGRKFRLAENGKKIIGFHGYAEKNLISLGAYFTNSTSYFTKLEYKMRGRALPTSYLWDDGTFKGVKKVYVRFVDENTGTYIAGVRFHYDNGGKEEIYEHGSLTLWEKGEFKLDYPNEFITSVETTLRGDGLASWVASITFKTSTGRISPTFGTPTNDKFVLESKGLPLVGVHGVFTFRAIYALGAYFLSPDAEKVELDEGASWDDGRFDSVRNIYIGHSEMGVTFLKFIYDKDNKAVIGDDHGNKITSPGLDEFVLNYPSEYLISVEAGYDEVKGSESQVIRMLKFKTNLRTSQVFGNETSISYILQMKSHKIGGFNGKFTNVLNHLGIHVVPLA